MSSSGMRLNALGLLLSLASLGLCACGGGRTPGPRTTGTRPPPAATSRAAPGPRAPDAYGCDGDPLPSWEDRAPKRQLLSFLARVTHRAAPDFVPPVERVAALDLDGTLWVERPLYPVIDFLLRRAEEHAAAATSPVVEALRAGGRAQLHQLDPVAVTAALERPNRGLSPAVFRQAAYRYVTQHAHPRFGRSPVELIYQPMKELIALLRHHRFEVFVVTGSEQEFARSFALEALGIPPSRVIGSTLVHRVEERDGRLSLSRMPISVEPFNNGEGKAIHIQRRLGRAPLVAIGNSDGDLAMLRYAAARPGPSLTMVVHHDDPAREYAYDEGAHDILSRSAALGIQVVSMAEDFTALFAHSPRATSCAVSLGEAAAGEP